MSQQHRREHTEKNYVGANDAYNISRISWNFRFGLESGTVPPVRDTVKRFVIGSTPDGAIPHQHSPKLPICGRLLQHLSLPQRAYGWIRLPTGT